MEKKKLIVLTGAGISAESGIQTFRGSDGLWEGHDIMEVASPEGWAANPELVLDFYNKRRKQLETVEPNAAHFGLVELEEFFEVIIITQNVDNLHERAGSSKVVHLHGELTKVESTIDPGYIGDIEYQDLLMGDKCPKGGQLRPHVVWFGENVPNMQLVAPVVQNATDILAVIGTSLLVYPAASLVHLAPPFTPLYLIDPEIPEVDHAGPVMSYKEKASTGVAKMKEHLLENYLES